MRSGALLVVLALGLGACQDPDLTVPTTPSSSDASDDGSTTPGAAGDVPDPRNAILQAAGADLLATLRDAHTGFDGLSRAASRDDALPIARRLLAVLAADPRWQDVDQDGAPDELGVRPLLPGPSNSREDTVDYGDAFSVMLTASRDAGAMGAAYIDVLRNPIVADLGAWQRDTAGMLAGIESAVSGVRSIPDAEQAVSEISGEAARSLAWAILAARATDLATIQSYGAHGAVHVELMLDAVTPLVEG